MMAAVTVLPGSREVIADLRGTDRGLRVSTHAEQGLVVLSIWRDDRCVASVQVSAGEIPALISVLASGLAEMAPAAPSPIAV